MEEKKREIKLVFDNKVKELSVSCNCALLEAEKYADHIANIERIKRGGKKSTRDYRMLKSYDILVVNGTKKLIYPVSSKTAPIRYYVSADELFGVLLRTHLKLGHGGRDRMLYEIKTKYRNITAKQIQVFLDLCEPCQQKKSGLKKGVVVQPMVFPELDSRGQLDLIDMQAQADGEFKFIFVYQDHLTKYISLRALTSNQAKEVAHHLLDVFLVFGAPCVLQSNNGREFCNAIITCLKEMWPELHIVHGESRHSHSQGSVERANQDIENMIFTWMTDHLSTSWSAAIRFVQFMKNGSFHAGIKRSPYEALFGCHPKVGLDVLALPEVILKTLRTEEDVEEVLRPTHPTLEEHSGNGSASTAADSTVAESTHPRSFCTSARRCTMCVLMARALGFDINNKRKESQDSLTVQAK